MRLVGNTGIWLDVLCSSEMRQQLKLEFIEFWLCHHPSHYETRMCCHLRTLKLGLLAAAVRKILVSASPWGCLIHATSGPRASEQAYARGFRPHRSGQLFGCMEGGEVFRIRGVAGE